MREATVCPKPNIWVRIGNLPCFQQKGRSVNNDEFLLAAVSPEGFDENVSDVTALRTRFA
jgi:hypothetical protein